MSTAPIYSCLVSGDHLHATWAHFGQWRDEMEFSQHGTVMRVEYLAPLDLSYFTVVGEVWLERLRSWFASHSIVVTWLGSISNMDNSWTSAMLNSGDLPNFGGPRRNPKRDDPFSGTLERGDNP